MERLNVFYDGYGAHRLIGQLAINNNQPVFQYDAAWLQDALPLSPLELLTDARLYLGYDKSQYSVPGLIADCLPDGWGILLMDRFFRKYRQKEPYQINVLERLAYIGHSAMGALSFEPEQHFADTPQELDLYELAQASRAVTEGEETQALRTLLMVGGSPQGARPKAQVKFHREQHLISSLPSAAGEDWLVKFPARGESASVCALEQVYALMARQCGLDMPESRFFDLGDEYAAFGVKRFDRQDTNRIHIHTLAGLLNADFRMPSLSYSQLLRCTRFLTRSEQEVEKAYRQCVFNVVFNNRDDHSKNFSFLMNQYGDWFLSPAYDLSFNTGFNGEHNMDIMGEGRRITRQHLLALAKSNDINPSWAKQTIAHIIDYAAALPELMADYPLEAELRCTVWQHIEQNLALLRDER